MGAQFEPPGSDDYVLPIKALRCARRVSSVHLPVRAAIMVIRQGRSGGRLPGPGLHAPRIGLGKVQGIAVARSGHYGKSRLLPLPLKFEYGSTRAVAVLGLNLPLYK